MRFILLFLSVTSVVTCLHAQPKINETGKILFADNDTVYYVYSPPNNARSLSSKHSVRNLSFRPGKFIIINNNKIGWPGIHTYKTKRDSIVLRTNKQQAFLFKATNGKDTISIYSNFVNADPYYDAPYKKKYTGVASYEIPKVFELANILLALSDSGRKDDNLIFKESAYHKEVMDYFGKYKTHAAVAFIDTTFTRRSKFGTYRDALDHAIGYDLVNGKIKPHKVYPDRWGQSFWTWQMKTLEDFAKQSNFESFYSKHKFFYDSLISQQKKYMPVKEMWSWLEREFPFSYHSYKIIFSPLVGGSHSTARFEVNGFTEVIMFVNSVLRQKAEKPAVMEGLMSGIVFTEIDHNYVNPVSDNYKVEINEIFSNRQVWAGSDGTDAANYNNAMAVFNEYMTHALFCLYASLKYSEEDFKVINSARQAIMNRRGFVRFKEFNEKLTELYRAKKTNEKVTDLYPQILQWAGEVK